MCDLEISYRNAAGTIPKESLVQRDIQRITTEIRLFCVAPEPQVARTGPALGGAVRLIYPWAAPARLIYPSATPARLIFTHRLRQPV